MHNRNPIYKEFEQLADDESEVGNNDWEVGFNEGLEVAKKLLARVIHNHQKKDKPKTEKCGHE